MGCLHWGDGDLTLALVWSDAAPVSLQTIRTGNAALDLPHTVPFAEILTADSGRTSASDRLDHSQIGRDLRYVAHREGADSRSAWLRVDQRDPARDIEATIELRVHHGSDAVNARVHLANAGTRDVVLLSVTSWHSAFGQRAGVPPSFDEWMLVSGVSEWLGESRWSARNLRSGPLPRIAEELTGHDRRSAVSEASSGTWSTAGTLPTAGIESHSQRIAWAWQIEHNGGWRWDVAEDLTGGCFALSGPTDRNHSFAKVLRPGDRFSTVPVTVAIGHDFEGAIGSLTRHRRQARRPHADNTSMPVVYNDYMNTLNGDPTSEKLHPLIDAAAEVGAEVFCIDAGWYDDTGSWWGSVGEWMPSARRFPGGLSRVTDRIRELGMIPGLWLEPEVVGVRSPVVQALPREAFFQRHGTRLEEHERHHLDLRHPAAVEHLNGIVDRLVEDLGIGYFKFDYNINPGPGTDLHADSSGEGLLQHNRAHLRWLDAVLDRHPLLIIENCASGAMRMDYALLSRLHLQSTSDQQDFRLYPPIAAAAPLSMLPEQAASWAYPQPGMTDEEVAFCLTTGLLGRFYLSGFIDRLPSEQSALVRSAVDTAQHLRPLLQRSVPVWPLGLPTWTSPWVVLGLHIADVAETLVSIWRRPGDGGHSEPPEVRLTLPHFRGAEVAVETVFPQDLPRWSTTWDSSAGALLVGPAEDVSSARVFRVRATRTRASGLGDG